MHGYKYPAPGSRAHKTPTLQPQSAVRTGLRFKMLCSTCVLPLLALYMLPEETSCAGLRVKKEVNWLEQEMFLHPHDGSDQGDLSVGDAGEADKRSPHSETFLAPPEQVSPPRKNQFHHRGNEKRRKVAPLDSISSFQMSSLRNRKDKPDIYSEEHRE